MHISAIPAPSSHEPAAAGESGSRDADTSAAAPSGRQGPHQGNCIKCDARAAVCGGRETPAYLFQLPGESRPLTRHMSLSLRGVPRLDADIRAPPGFAYMAHSLRSGGSSAAEAIGVSRSKGNWLGSWSQTSTTRERHSAQSSDKRTADTVSVKVPGGVRARAHIRLGPAPQKCTSGRWRRSRPCRHGRGW